MPKPTSTASKTKATTPTRVGVDVARFAAAVADAEHRSTTEQISYWARLGMQVERSTSVATRMVRAAVAGDAQFADLTPEERVAAHAIIDAGIRERASRERFGVAARAAGQSTVVLDDDGSLVEIAPDGSRRPL